MGFIKDHEVRLIGHQLVTVLLKNLIRGNDDKLIVIIEFEDEVGFMIHDYLH